jgi:hypothetical protein
MSFTLSLAIRASVTYARPASAEPSATFETMLATFGSWLTVLVCRTFDRPRRRSNARV